MAKKKKSEGPKPTAQESSSKKPSIASSETSSTKTPTIPRFTKADKDRLSEDNKAVYVALPKSLKTKRASTQTLLVAHVAKHAPKGLQQILPSADSYLAAVFDTTAHRDQAIQTLRKVNFKVEGKAVAIVVHPFGDSNSGRVTVWCVVAGYGDTPESLSVMAAERLKGVDPEGQFTAAGTGKTRTAEITLLLLIELDSRVLLITGSNKGIDNLAEAVIAAPSKLSTAGVVCDQLDGIMDDHTIHYNAAMSTAWEGLMSQLLYRPELDRVLLTYDFVLSV